MPALAVTALLHERATASARWPTRAAALAGAIAGAAEAGDAQDRQVGRRIPPDELGIERLAVVPADAQAVLAAERPNRGDDDAVAVDESAGRTTPPWTWTTEGATAATASAI